MYHDDSYAANAADFCPSDLPCLPYQPTPEDWREWQEIQVIQSLDTLSPAALAEVRRRTAELLMRPAKPPVTPANVGDDCPF